MALVDKYNACLILKTIIVKKNFKKSVIPAACGINLTDFDVFQELVFSKIKGRQRPRLEVVWTNSPKRQRTSRFFTNYI